MSDAKLPAVTRTEFGKGAARRIRRAHQVPAVLYGHGAAPLHITLPGHETMLALKHANALLTIQVDGDEHLAIAKDVQRNATKDFIEHVDLLTVIKGEKIAVVVPVRVIGESVPGTIHLLDSQTVHIEAEATQLPEFVEASVEGLDAGTAVRAADLILPPGTTYLGDPRDLILTVSLPQISEEAEEAEAEAAAEGAEGAETAEGAEAAEAAEES